MVQWVAFAPSQLHGPHGFLSDSFHSQNMPVCGLAMLIYSMLLEFYRVHKQDKVVIEINAFCIYNLKIECTILTSALLLPSNLFVYIRSSSTIYVHIVYGLLHTDLFSV